MVVAMARLAIKRGVAILAFIRATMVEPVAKVR
jgi:hypothetical protein